MLHKNQDGASFGFANDVYDPFCASYLSSAVNELADRSVFNFSLLRMHARTTSHLHHVPIHARIRLHYQQNFAYAVG